MIAVDTNILVSAHRRDSGFHRAASSRLRDLAEGQPSWALPWPCVHEFLAIVTHPRIYDPPSSLEAATDQVAAWLESPSVVLLSEGDDHWDRLSSAVMEARIAGPVVHDARIVALCRSHGVEALWTIDRDFGRFPELKTFNPLI